jgi:ankyrin repeat protein
MNLRPFIAMNLRPFIAWRLTRCTNRDGDTALHAACKNGDALALELLVKAGCDVKHVNK